MKFPLCVTRKKQTASFRMVGLVLTIAPLWLMLAATTSAYAQTSNDVSKRNATVSPSPSDWTQFHRDNMQRWNPYETVLNVNSVKDLKVKWNFAHGAFDSSPAVVNGVVYFGSWDENVYAVDASTGTKLWSYAVGSGVYSSPAVANGVVYIGSIDHNVYALDAGTGAKLWSFSTGNSVESSPAVANGVVYVSSDDGKVYALNAATGAKLWSYAAESGVYTSPAVANGVVYVGNYYSLVVEGDGVYALNATTGALLWSYAVEGGVYSSPAVAGGVVYTTSGEGNVYAVNASTGHLLWGTSLSDSPVESSPAVANGVVYIDSDDGSAYALNANTGAQVWSHKTGDYIVPSSAAVANGVVYFASADGHVYALNASTGTLLWSYLTASTEGPQYSSPTIVGGVVYYAIGSLNTGGGVLYAFAPSSSLNADLFLRIWPSTTTVHQGDLLTYAFPVWNLGPNNADQEVLNTRVPAGTTFDYIRISGTPGLGTCTRPPYLGTGPIVCHENSAMAPNTTWTVRLTVKVTASPGATITANAATMADTPDPNLANNMATVSIKVQ